MLCWSRTYIDSGEYFSLVLSISENFATYSLYIYCIIHLSGTHSSLTLALKITLHETLLLSLKTMLKWQSFFRFIYWKEKSDLLKQYLIIKRQNISLRFCNLLHNIWTAMQSNRSHHTFSHQLRAFLNMLRV